MISTFCTDCRKQWHNTNVLALSAVGLVIPIFSFTLGKKMFTLEKIYIFLWWCTDDTNRCHCFLFLQAFPLLEVAYSKKSENCSTNIMKDAERSILKIIFNFKGLTWKKMKILYHEESLVGEQCFIPDTVLVLPFKKFIVATAERF